MRILNDFKKLVLKLTQKKKSDSSVFEDFIGYEASSLSSRNEKLKDKQSGKSC
jgi:hypothetical protein